MVFTIEAGFATYPNEMGKVSRMLAGWGDIEFGLCDCLRAASDNDLNLAIQVMFRARGEDARLSVVDALIRKKYQVIGLGDTYNAMLGAYRWCKSVRNQYAHCQWFFRPDHGVIYFSDFDKAAEASALNKPSLQFNCFDAQLIEAQWQYFTYTSILLMFLAKEYDKRQGRLQNHPYSVPAVLEQPPRYNPPTRDPFGPSNLGNPTPQDKGPDTQQ